jgi:hypothetical protein
MSNCYSVVARLFLFILLFVAGTGSVFAEPVTGTLSGVTFTDGGTASGSFVYDADSAPNYLVSSWSISVAGGDTATFPPLTYDQSNSSGFYDTAAPLNDGLILSLSGSLRQIRIPAITVLSDASGNLPVNTAGLGAAECYNCGPARLFSGGTLIGTAPPSITSAANTSFMLNTASTFMVTATSAPVPSLSVSGTLPSGVSFVDNGDGTGTFSGTPTVAGIYPLTVTASNTTGPNAPQSFTLAVDSAPSITSANATTFVTAGVGSFFITTNGVPAPSLNISGGVPAGIIFTDNGDGTALLSGSASAGTGGVYALVITATNGINPGATQNFSLTVDQAAQITSAASITFNAGSHAVFSITSSGYPTACTEPCRHPPGRRYFRR